MCQVVRDGGRCRAVVLNDERDRPARGGGPVDEVDGEYDVGKIHARYRGPARGCAAGDDDRVGAMGEYGRRVGVGARPDGHAGPAESSPLPVDPAPVPVVASKLGGGGQGAAELVGAFPQLDGVALLCAQAGDLHAGWTAADHQDRARVGRGPRSRFGLAGELRAHTTGVGEAIDELAVNALVEPDAGADLVGTLFASLQRELGVGHRGPGNGDEIGVAGLDDRLGMCGFGHAPAVDDRQVRRLFDLAGERGPLVVVVPGDGDVAGSVPVVADVEAHVVDLTLDRERLDQRGAVVDGRARRPATGRGTGAVRR